MEEDSGNLAERQWRLTEKEMESKQEKTFVEYSLPDWTDHPAGDFVKDQEGRGKRMALAVRSLKNAGK